MLKTHKTSRAANKVGKKWQNKKWNQIKWNEMPGDALRQLGLGQSKPEIKHLTLLANKSC